MKPIARSFAAARVALLLLASCAQGAAALIPDVKWETILDLWHERTLGAVATNGDAVVAAEDFRTGCVVLAKVGAANGQQAWRTDVCTPRLSLGGVAFDPQGNVVAIGSVSTEGVSKSRVAKYSAATGALLWEHLDAGAIDAISLSIDTDGSMAVTLRTATFGHLVRKYSAEGAVLWSTPVDPPGAPPAFDSQHAVVVATHGPSITPENWRWTVTKLAASDGAVRWTHVTDGIGDYPEALALDPADNVIVTGAMLAGPRFERRIRTIKHAGSTGAVMWQVTEQEEAAYSHNSGRGIAIAPNGDAIVAATSNDNLHTIRYRGSDGARLWKTVYDGALGTRDFAGPLKIDAAGDVILAGEVNAIDTGGNIRVFKYSGANGAQIWAYGVNRPVTPYEDVVRAAPLALLPTADGLTVVGTYGVYHGMYVARYGTQLREPLNAGGLWWNTPAGSESGWGLNMTHQGEVIFLTWFTYNTDLTPLWFVMPRALNVERDTYVGRVYRTTGPNFAAVPFNPAQVNVTDVGQGRISITGPDTATFNYSANLLGITKNLTRQVFGPLPTCSMLPAGDATPNYQDLWYAYPANSEAGWGLNIAQQGDTMFLTWFTYGSSGQQMWYVGPATVRTEGNRFAGKLYRTTGMPYGAAMWDKDAVTAFEVGSVSLDFTAGDRATFTYTVDGFTQSKAITRQIYGTPATVCR